MTASFLYLRSPREFMRIAGSFPRLPQRLIVSVDTRNIFATSRTVSKSGHSSPRDIYSYLVISYLVISETNF